MTEKKPTTRRRSVTSARLYKYLTEWWQDKDFDPSSASVQDLILALKEEVINETIGDL